jgi:hypothetical protein
LQGLEEAIRSESPGIEIVDFLGWRVFVEANSVPIYVRGLADGALTLRSPLGTLVEGPDDQYLKLLLYANCGLVVTKGAGFCLDRNGRLSLERTIPGGLVAAELSRVYRRFAEAAVSWSGLVRSQSMANPSPTARTDCPISTFWRKHAQSRAASAWGGLTLANEHAPRSKGWSCKSL